MSTLVVIKNMFGEDGGELRTWSAGAEELQAAVARGDVMPFDERRCRVPIRCECGKLFITERARASHRADARPGRGCSV